MYKVKNAETEAETNSAYELFYRTFGPSYYESKEFFDSTRKHDPTLTHENLFIIKEGDEVIAALRAVNRTLTIFGEDFKIGGIATTAVHPEHRGKGLFNILTQFVLDKMIKRDLSLCLVFARRAIDNIYVKHGFWGAPVERIFRILDPPNIEDKNLNFRKTQIEDIPFLEKTYRAVYGHMPVFLDRTASLWMNGYGSRRFDCYIFEKSNEPVGYVISENEKGIVEIGSYDYNSDVYKPVLFSKDSPVREAANRSICLSTEHPAIGSLRGHSYSIFTRHPNYGGHMLKILNPYNRESRIMKMVESQLKTRNLNIPFDTNIPEHIFSRAITAATFGYEIPESKEIFGINILKPIDFIFSPLDEF